MDTIKNLNEKVKKSDHPNNKKASHALLGALAPVSAAGVVGWVAICFAPAAPTGPATAAAPAPLETGGSAEEATCSEFLSSA